MRLQTPFILMAFISMFSCNLNDSTLFDSKGKKGVLHFALGTGHFLSPLHLPRDPLARGARIDVQITSDSEDIARNITNISVSNRQIASLQTSSPQGVMCLYRQAQTCTRWQILQTVELEGLSSGLVEIRALDKYSDIVDAFDLEIEDVELIRLDLNNGAAIEEPLFLDPTHNKMNLRATALGISARELLVPTGWSFETSDETIVRIGQAPFSPPEAPDLMLFGNDSGDCEITARYGEHNAKVAVVVSK